MSDLLKQAATPQSDCIKFPKGSNACPKCGGPKWVRNKQCLSCRYPKPPVDPTIYEDEHGRYRRTPLTQGQYAQVDELDYERVSLFRYFAHWSRSVNKFYAVRKGAGTTTERYEVPMGNDILGLPISQLVDHINSLDTLNNRRFNLRIGDRSKNRINTQKAAGCSSIYKGVSWSKRNKRWHAEISLHGRRFHLGYFVKEVDAARAYNEKAKELFGEFARLNVIP